MATLKDIKFDYKILPLNKIGLELTLAKTPSEHSEVFHGGKFVSGIIIDDEVIKPSGRFWTSLYARFGINKSFFTFFDHSEVFERICQKESDVNVRVVIERNIKTGSSQLLAATGLRKPCVIYDDLLELLSRYELSSGINYANGIVTSTHAPRVGGVRPMKIAGDSFRHEMQLHTPIDGYGMPDIYLSLLRLICSNGMVAMSRRFKTTLSLGQGDDNIDFTLRRTLENFNNEAGYATLRDRFERAANSWCSLAEQQELYKLLMGIQNDSLLKTSETEKGEAFRTLMRDYRHLSGDVETRYFGANSFTSPKKMRSLPTAARVYELLNFATEVATHRVSENNARKLHGWVGSMLSSDYDLEDSCDQFDDWRGFFASETQKVIDEGKNQ